MINRVQEIKKKGFSMSPAQNMSDTYTPVDFSKIKIGNQTLQDVIYEVNTLKKANPHLADKREVLRAISDGDLNRMREISNFFYRSSGIYQRMCKYMAYMYRYDWFVTPYVNSESLKNEKILDSFNKVLAFLDNFHIKKFFGEVALKVMRNGCYYGYVITIGDKSVVQELPVRYCRSRFTTVEGRPCIEFNMRFFDEYFTDVNQRIKMLKLFPKEFVKGYKLYKEGKLPPQFQGDTSGWYILDTQCVFKFNMNGEDFPPFISVIPAILDLDDSRGLDKEKMKQELLKIIIQKMPIDKNGDLVFDVDEAQQLHNNAVGMVGKSTGTKVLTTFADVDVADMSSNAGTTAADERMERAKSTVYDEGGISQLQFNADNSVALEKSIINDEASVYNLIQQFEQFLNILIKPFNKSPKKIMYRVQILSTTIYNYKEMAKLYKEQTQLGYSKMLPQIALGQLQSSVLAAAYFENDILDLVNVFIPPMSSNTMSADVLANRGNNKSGGNANSDSENAGRPTNEEAGKVTTEKTVANRESQG